MFASFSAREPASIQTPTVAVSACGCDSVATVRPFESVVISVAGKSTAVANERIALYENRKRTHVRRELA